MSRAFVNEDTAAAQADQPVERQVSAQPNYVTPTGLALLQGRVAELQTLHAQETARGERADKQRLADIERDLRYFNQRLQSAQVVAPNASEQVRIGHWVTFVDEQDQEWRVQLVGEDQADAANGLVNWGSPLGRALLGATTGDEVVWERPAGNLAIEIVAIHLD
jgi:transcription elongation factor GreB